MLRFVILFNLVLCPLAISKRRPKHKDDGDLGGRLVTALRNDVNIDLSLDEEYEDLRAELLAYHTALASITPSRRSMKTTPCWKLGGICVDHKMCEGHRSLTQIPGCKNNLEVCCFKWNNYQVRDMKDKGLDNLAMPWSEQIEFGGKGVLEKENDVKKKKLKLKVKKHHALNDAYNDDLHLDNKYHGDLHLDNKYHDNPPLLVILRTKKKK